MAAERYSYLMHLANLGSTNVHPGRLTATDQLMAALELEDGLRVLEIGCGTAATLVRMASLYNLEMKGVDVLPEMLRVAKIRVRWSGRALETEAAACQPD